jgi:hypothetical protein
VYVGAGMVMMERGYIHSDGLVYKVWMMDTAALTFHRAEGCRGA